MASFADQWLVELYKAFLVVIGTIGVGQAVVASWQMRNKRRELDIASALQFQQMYGEYKDVWRVWKVLRSRNANDLGIPAGARFELLKRATAAEAKVEAVVVKLAVERTLSPSEISSVGLFRQGFQQLRQSIRNNKDMDFNYKDPEYRLFNDLAAAVAALILSEPPRRQPDRHLAAHQLEAIAKHRKKHWRMAKEAYKPYDAEDVDDDPEPA